MKLIVIAILLSSTFLGGCSSNKIKIINDEPLIKMPQGDFRSFGNHPRCSEVKAGFFKIFCQMGMPQPDHGTSVQSLLNSLEETGLEYDVKSKDLVVAYANVDGSTNRLFKFLYKFSNNQFVKAKFDL